MMLTEMMIIKIMMMMVHGDVDDEDEQHLGSMSVLLTAAVGVERQH